MNDMVVYGWSSILYDIQQSQRIYFIMDAFKISQTSLTVCKQYSAILTVKAQD